MSKNSGNKIGEGEQGLEIQQNKGVKIGKLDYKTCDIYSYLQENGKPFTYNDFPLIVAKINNDNTAILIIALNGKSIKIIWENNGPKIFEDSSKSEFLLGFDEENSDGKNKKCCLYNIAFANVCDNINYPVKTITIDGSENIFLIIESNKDFYRVYCIDDGKYYTCIKKDKKYLKVKVEHFTEYHGTDGSFNKLPTKDTLNLFGDKLVYWDEEKQIFKLFELNGQILTGVNQENAYYNPTFSITTGTNKLNSPIKIYFTPSHKKPKDVAKVTINGIEILACEKVDKFNEDWEFLGKKRKPKKKPKLTTIEKIIIVDFVQLKIDLEKKFEVGSHEFFKCETLNGETRYTDGKKVYEFETNEQGGVKFYNYEGVNYPILRDNSFTKLGKKINQNDEKNKTFSTVNVNAGNVEEIYIMENEIDGEKQEGKINEKKVIKLNVKIPVDNTNISGEKKERDKSIIGIYANHGIVCLANNYNNTSRFEFYRINPDGTLTLTYRNNYKISITPDGVTLIGSGNNSDSCILVRRPGTTSIFEPVVINSKEYLIAKSGLRVPNQYTYIEITDNNTDFEVIQLDINPKTFLPANSFEFEGETLYYNEDGKIKIGRENYYFCNKNGEIVDNPKEAISDTGNNSLLLLLKDSHGYTEIYGYSPKLKNTNELKRLNHQRGVYLESHIIKVQINGKNYICSLDDEGLNILSIIEFDGKEDFFTRYVNKKNGGKSDIEGEEFTCMGENIEICEVLSEEYLRGTEGQVYYRKGQGKELEKVFIPEGVKVNDFPTVKTHDDEIYALNNNNGKLIGASEEYYYMYLLDENSIEITLNGEKKLVVNFWNSRTNKIVSFEKKGDNFLPLEIGNTKLSFKIDENTITFHVNKTLSIYIPDNNIEVVKISNHENGFGVLLQAEEGNIDNRFQEIFDISNGSRKVCPIYEVNGKKIAFDLSKKGNDIRISGEGNIIINDIEYGKEIINQIYENNRPENNSVEGTVGGIVDKVEGII